MNRLEQNDLIHDRLAQQAHYAIPSSLMKTFLPSKTGELMSASLNTIESDSFRRKS